MKEIAVEIKKRNRDYGIITWSFRQDDEVKSMLLEKKVVPILVGDRLLGDRKVDYKYRRISLPKKYFEQYPKSEQISLSVSKGIMKVNFH